MFESDVEKLLKAYEDNKARLKLLELEQQNISNYESVIDSEYEALQLSSTTYDTPTARTNKIHSKVESIIINRNINVQHNKVQLQSDIKFIQNEVLKVDIMLSRLCLEERFIVKQKYFADKEFRGWKAIAREHAREFEKEYPLNWKSLKWRVKNKILPFLESLLK